jgi:DNA-binding HxlR family transcriptional regulator
MHPENVTSKPRRRSDCPIAFSLDLFGDRWSLLIVRDLVFKGRTSFGEFLAAGEGIATNVLAERLERLEGAGVITKRRDPDKGTKFVYGLTERGIELVPLLLEMIAWSGRHDPRTAVPKKFLRELENNRDEVTRRTIRDIRNRHHPSRSGAR